MNKTLVSTIALGISCFLYADVSIENATKYSFRARSGKRMIEKTIAPKESVSFHNTGGKVELIFDDNTINGDLQNKKEYTQNGGWQSIKLPVADNEISKVILLFDTSAKFYAKISGNKEYTVYPS